MKLEEKIFEKALTTATTLGTCAEPAHYRCLYIYRQNRKKNLLA